jgi:hypothetical protein
MSSIVDTGASYHASGYQSDFVPGTLTDLPQPLKLDSIAGSLLATKVGIIRHSVLSDSGTAETLELPTVFMPGLATRLISPQLYLRQLESTGQGVGEYVVQSNASFLRLPNKRVITLGYDSLTNLPMLTCFRNLDATAAGLAMTCLSDETNQNLTLLQKALLQWHFCTGHLGFQHLQWCGREGFFGKPGIGFGRSFVSPPKCASCQYGRQQRRTAAGSTKHADQEHAGILKRDKLQPGDLVFSDQYESRVPGRVFGLQGAHISSQKYCGGTLFMDAASGYIAIQHQQHLTAFESIRAKQAFEQDAMTAGVSILDYHTYNGIYTSQEYLKELHSKGQGCSLSAVGAHHHNGVAEASIKHVIARAHTMQIHAALRWPDVSDRELWPMALANAGSLHNITPNMKTGRSPEEVWTHSHSTHSWLRNVHVWGCPLYILDPRGQAGHKLPAWDPRSRCAQNMGFSPLHASSVALTRNLTTGNISPQFHVVYDDFFETVHTNGDDPPDVWSDLVIVPTYHAHLDDDAPESIPELSDEWLNPSELADRHPRLLERKRAEHDSKTHTPNPPRDDPPLADIRAPPDPVLLSPPVIASTTALLEEDDPMYDALEEAPPPVTPEEVPSHSSSRTSINHPASQIFESTYTNSDGSRRSSRHRPDYRRFTHMAVLLLQASRILMSRSINYYIQAPTNMNFAYALLLDPEYGLLDGVMPHRPAPLYKAGKANADPDTPDIGTALSGPDAHLFHDAMRAEISTT